VLALINIITNSQESYNLPVVKFNTNTEENILSLRIRKTWREESGMDDEGGSVSRENTSRVIFQNEVEQFD